MFGYFRFRLVPVGSVADFVVGIVQALPTCSRYGPGWGTPCWRENGPIFRSAGVGFRRADAGCRLNVASSSTSVATDPDDAQVVSVAPGEVALDVVLRTAWRRGELPPAFRVVLDGARGTRRGRGGLMPTSEHARPAAWHALVFQIGTTRRGDAVAQ